ncbi:alpha/beta hydrolase [Arcticibacter eurypsychrophilus]|uniref:alpha/beta hydrolase n=1 Tax=Arcticibacter eurypsychrophilus TaxID=1434752 RepID=UPI00084CEF9A|nr:alpha/beta hydrolase [Arcticibacter eurypsychrophilus]
MKAYFISGLGCDRRAFQRIVLPSEYEIVHLDWLMPEDNESIEHYSARLAEPIGITEPFVLVGLSFGGMIAVEISKFKKPHKLFLISSIATRSSLPALYKVCGLLHLDKIVPAKWLRYPNIALYWVFGPLTQETKLLFKGILFETDPIFLKWALGVIARWKSTQLPEQLIQIHGRRDRIFNPF